MLFPQWIIDHIAQSLYWADRTVRADLIAGLISGENDYTSNLTATIRRQINARAVPKLSATSYVLKPIVERSVGADACIVLASEREFKICLFEAKWPRLSTHNNYWDSVQKNRRVSHYDDQLHKQQRVSSIFAVWEMFYCEFPYGKQPSFMPSHVSACVWQHDAIRASQERPGNDNPWTDQELEDLLRNASSQVDHLIREVCLCHHGQRFNGNDFLSVFEEYEVPSEVLVIKYAGEDAQQA